MASRSKTLLFQQYRSSYSRSIKSYPIHNEQDNLLGNQQQRDTTAMEDIELGVLNLPPKWVDIVEDVEDDVSKIKESSMLKRGGLNETFYIFYGKFAFIPCPALILIK